MMKILFLDGTPGFYPNRLNEKPTGGILTSLTHIPRLLVKAGHDVSIASLHKVNETVEGVKYIGDLIEKNVWDVVVFNRNFLDRDMVRFFRDSYKILWLHDVADPSYFKDDAFSLVDKVVALSIYQRDCYSDFYSIPSDRFLIIPNGVDKKIFYRSEYVERRDDLFVSSSAPIKGLYPLEYTMSNMKRWDSNIEMRLYSSQKLHEMEDSARHKGLMGRIAAAGASVLDPIPQKELADVFRSATALLMPNSYPEMCSNLLLQAQACGLPVIATNIGSAPEYITHRLTGMLTDRGPQDLYWWHHNFVKQCAEVFYNKGLREEISRLSPIGVRSWEDIGDQWGSMLNNVFSAVA